MTGDFYLIKTAERVCDKLDITDCDFKLEMRNASL